MHNKSEIHLNCMPMREKLEQDTMLCCETENVDYTTLVCLELQKKVSPGVFPEVNQLWKVHEEELHESLQASLLHILLGSNDFE